MNAADFIADNWLTLLTSPIWSPLLLLVLYALWVQQERGGWWRLFRFFESLGIPLDILMAHSVFPLYVWDFPKKTEWTISDHLARLVTDKGWRGYIARRLARLLNLLAPTGKHI